MQLTRTQISKLPLGFTPTGEMFSRKFRRSKEYQKLVDKYYKEQALALAKESQLANFIKDEEGNLVHNP